MSTFKVVITDYFFPNLDLENQELQKIGAQLEELDTSSEGKMTAQLQEADAVLNCFFPISEQMVHNMEKCKVIARYGIGVDTIPIDVATEKGIMVTNVPDYCVDEVSEHALTLILASARKIVPLYQEVQKGIWDYRAHRPITRLSGKVLGLIGFGRISRALAGKAAALGMKIIAFDPYVKAEDALQHGVKLLELNEVMEEADFISVHTPLTKGTYHLIGLEELRKMKNTAFIINTSRGGIIDEEALATQLKDHLIGGAALDVIEEEHNVQNSRLRGLNNCLLTPHTAFFSEESITELQYKAVQQVIIALQEGTPTYLMNQPALHG